MDSKQQKAEDFSNGFFIFLSPASGSMLVLDFDAREEREREREREREKWVDFQLLHIGFIGALFLDDAVYLIQMFSSFSNFL